MGFIKKYFKYIVSFFLALFFSISIMIYELPLLPVGIQSVFRAWCDGCFFSGAGFLSFGLLGLIADADLFNSMNYAFKRIGNRIMHPRKFNTDFISYYEYVQAKEHNSRRFVFLFITGLVFLLLSFIFLFCFYVYY